MVAGALDRLTPLARQTLIASSRHCGMHRFGELSGGIQTDAATSFLRPVRQMRRTPSQESTTRIVASAARASLTAPLGGAPGYESAHVRRRHDAQSHSNPSFNRATGHSSAVVQCNAACGLAQRELICRASSCDDNGREGTFGAEIVTKLYGGSPANP